MGNDRVSLEGVEGRGRALFQDIISEHSQSH